MRADVTAWENRCLAGCCASSVLARCATGYNASGSAAANFFASADNLHGLSALPWHRARQQSGPCRQPAVFQTPSGPLPAGQREPWRLPSGPPGSRPRARRIGVPTSQTADGAHIVPGTGPRSRRGHNVSLRDTFPPPEARARAVCHAPGPGGRRRGTANPGKPIPRLSTAAITAGGSLCAYSHAAPRQHVTYHGASVTGRFMF
jgi:hypothetical protein